MNTDQSISPVSCIQECSSITIDQDTYAYTINGTSGVEAKLKVLKDFIYFFHSDSALLKLQLISPDAVVESRRGDLTYFAFPYGDSDLLMSREEGEDDVQILAISIKKLHAYFGSDFGDRESVDEFLMSFRMKKYFTVKAVSAEVAVAFHQMFHNALNGPHQSLYLQGKVMEILSLYLQKPKEKSELEKQCPFVVDHLEMGKIREARDLVISDLSAPPTLKDLARAVGTNEFKLKVGFKSMFGTTVYAYLTDFRMNEARKLLSNQQLNVKDVSHRIGYANPSHFIAAYKKKFGITPKRQLKHV